MGKTVCIGSRLPVVLPGTGLVTPAVQARDKEGRTRAK